jgi:hypothetical protein
MHPNQPAAPGQRVLAHVADTDLVGLPALRLETDEGFGTAF